MKYKVVFLFIIAFSIISCKPAQLSKNKQPQWNKLALAYGVEIYIDTACIVHEGSVVFATEKRVFTTPESKAQYLSKISEEYVKMGKPEKIKKWNDFSYCIYHSIYECTEKRFRVLWVEDYDSAGKLIIKTSPAKDKHKWLNIEKETVGDYTFFYVCDFGQ